jgi:predicted AlkP superfamily phosphohydrolase/phosphomutase/tetratricopeptide (TPR) repeat protein
MGKRIVKKLLFIGWDAADWKVINPMLEKGHMPALKGLMERGVSGNIATMDPPFSPMLWSSIATGKYPDKHGILGFIEPDPSGGGVRPVSSSSRTARALWNIFTHKGIKSNVVSWWPSQPVEPIDGVMVSNFFHKETGTSIKDWALAPDSVHPKELENEIADLRMHPQEVTPAHILPFIPNAANINQKEDKRLGAFCKELAHCTTTHAVGTYLMENTEWEFTAMYFDSIDHFSHGFMKYHPPQLPGLPDDLFEMYKGVVEGGYRYHDMMLERALALAGDDTHIMLLSDHGFHSDHLRPLSLPKKIDAVPALEHRNFGILCVAGPGIKKGEKVFGATLLDIAPTVLTMFGLPIGKDMDGKPLTNIFEEQPELEFIDSWEDVEGNFGEHPEHINQDPIAAAEAMKQLVELGYIEDPGEDKNKAMEKAKRHLRYNLSRVYKGQNKYAEALNILEELIKEDEVNYLYNIDLINLYFLTEEYDKSLDRIDIFKKQSKENKGLASVRLLEAKALLNKGLGAMALDILEDIAAAKPRSLGIHLELGNAYLNVYKFEKAIDAYKKALDIDHENARAFNGIASAYFKLGKYEEAATNAIQAVELIFHYPLSHLLLAQSLEQLGAFEDAANAYEITLSQAPKNVKAQKALINLYETKLNNSERATELRKKHGLEATSDSDIVVVSGLPRSGTSMMMQMIEAGGVEVLTDGQRTADSNNPKGYYEDERIKKLAQDNSWVGDGQGKCMKVIAQLLKHLPKKYNYKVVFMKRDMGEVLRSQQIMLKRNPDEFPMAIANAFQKELEFVQNWAKTEPSVSILYLDYKDVIANPVANAEKISEFLGKPLSIEQMAQVVDPSLYRNKVS